MQSHAVSSTHKKKKNCALLNEGKFKNAEISIGFAILNRHRIALICIKEQDAEDTNV